MSVAAAAPGAAGGATATSTGGASDLFATLSPLGSSMLRSSKRVRGRVVVEWLSSDVLVVAASACLFCLRFVRQQGHPTWMTGRDEMNPVMVVRKEVWDQFSSATRRRRRAVQILEKLDLGHPVVIPGGQMQSNSTHWGLRLPPSPTRSLGDGSWSVGESSDDEAPRRERTRNLDGSLRLQRPLESPRLTLTLPESVPHWLGKGCGASDRFAFVCIAAPFILPSSLRGDPPRSDASLEASSVQSFPQEDEMPFGADVGTGIGEVDALAKAIDTTARRSTQEAMAEARRTLRERVVGEEHSVTSSMESNDEADEPQRGPRRASLAAYGQHVDIVHDAHAVRYLVHKEERSRIAHRMHDRLEAHGHSPPPVGAPAPSGPRRMSLSDALAVEAAAAAAAAAVATTDASLGDAWSDAEEARTGHAQSGPEDAPTGSGPRGRRNSIVTPEAVVTHRPWQRSPKKALSMHPEPAARSAIPGAPRSTPVAHYLSPARDEAALAARPTTEERHLLASREAQLREAEYQLRTKESLAMSPEGATLSFLGHTLDRKRRAFDTLRAEVEPGLAELELDAGPSSTRRATSPLGHTQSPSPPSVPPSRTTRLDALPEEVRTRPFSTFHKTLSAMAGSPSEPPAPASPIRTSAIARGTTLVGSPLRRTLAPLAASLSRASPAGSSAVTSSAASTSLASPTAPSPGSRGLEAKRAGPARPAAAVFLPSPLEKVDIPKNDRAAGEGKSEGLASLSRNARIPGTEEREHWEKFYATRLLIKPAHADFGMLRIGVEYCFPIGVRNLAPVGRRFRVRELVSLNLHQQVSLRVRFKGRPIPAGSRLDLMLLVCAEQPCRFEGRCVVEVEGEPAPTVIPINARFLNATAFQDAAAQAGYGREATTGQAAGRSHKAPLSATTDSLATAIGRTVGEPIVSASSGAALTNRFRFESALGKTSGTTALRANGDGATILDRVGLADDAEATTRLKADHFFATLPLRRKMLAEKDIQRIMTSTKGLSPEELHMLEACSLERRKRPGRIVPPGSRVKIQLNEGESAETLVGSSRIELAQKKAKAREKRERAKELRERREIARREGLPTPEDSGAESDEDPLLDTIQLRGVDNVAEDDTEFFPGFVLPGRLTSLHVVPVLPSGEWPVISPEKAPLFAPIDPSRPTSRSKARLAPPTPSLRRTAESSEVQATVVVLRASESDRESADRSFVDALPDGLADDVLADATGMAAASDPEDGDTTSDEEHDFGVPSEESEDEDEGSHGDLSQPVSVSLGLESGSRSSAVRSRTRRARWVVPHPSAGPVTPLGTPFPEPQRRRKPPAIPGLKEVVVPPDSVSVASRTPSETPVGLHSASPLFLSRPSSAARTRN